VLLAKERRSGRKPKKRERVLFPAGCLFPCDRVGIWNKVDSGPNSVTVIIVYNLSVTSVLSTLNMIFSVIRYFMSLW